MPRLASCIVLHGPNLIPHHCRNFHWEHDTITRLDLGAPCDHLTDGALVIIPGLYNGHTHVGDGALPDGAAGLTLEEGFFRPHGYKYRELAKLDRPALLTHLVDTLRFMARTGTVGHLDFREQGVFGAELLREAAETTGMGSVILNQFDESPQMGAQLEDQSRPLADHALAILRAMLATADGFSESTMNDLTDAAWRQVVTETEAVGKLRAIHCLENPGYRDLSLRRTGRGDLIRAIEVLAPHLIVHLTEADDTEVRLMADSGITAALNPRANATLGLKLPPLIPLLDAGANLLLGTDNVMLNPPNLFAELDFTYRLARSQAGESRAAHPAPADLLRMVTSNIRPVLGGDHYGYLDAGLPASFVVINFHAPHLRHTRNLLTSLISRVGTADVLATYRRGRPLWESADSPLAN